MSGQQYIRANLAWTPSPGILELRSDHLLIIDDNGMIDFSQPYDCAASQKVLEGAQKRVESLSPFGFLFPAFIVSAALENILR
jgi:hypothetical protein